MLCSCSIPHKLVKEDNYYSHKECIPFYVLLPWLFLAVLVCTAKGSLEVKILGSRSIQPIDIYLMIFNDDIGEWKDREEALAGKEPRVSRKPVQTLQNTTLDSMCIEGVPDDAFNMGPCKYMCDIPVSLP